MRVWLMATTMALVVAAAAVIVACGGDGGGGMSTLSEEEAWSIVVEKLKAHCPKLAGKIGHEPWARFAFHEDDGDWTFSPSPLGVASGWMRFTVDEAARTVTGNRTALYALSGRLSNCH